MSAGRSVGLVIPTAWEAREVLRQFPFKRDGKVRRAELMDHTLLLFISGVGRKAAASAADVLIAAGAKELVSAGVCGALVPSLQAGDLVTDRIASIDHAVCKPQDRQALAQKAGAIAVDMETQAVVETGTRRGVPIRILRVVSDTFEDDLTPLFGPSGKFSRWGIALRLLNPRVWPLAARLKRQSQVARLGLAKALADYLSERS